MSPWGKSGSNPHASVPTGWLLDTIAQGDDDLERLHGGVAVVDLLGLRQLLIRHQARVLLLLVIAARAMLPAISQPLPGPDFMGVLGQALRQFQDVGTQLHL